MVLEKLNINQVEKAHKLFLFFANRHKTKNVKSHILNANTLFGLEFTT